MIESIRTPERLDVAFALSWLIVVPAVLAALAVGVDPLLPGVCRETVRVGPHDRGQELETRLALSVMVLVQRAAPGNPPTEPYRIPRSRA